MIDESLIQIRKMEESDVYDELYDLIVKTDNKRCLEKLETKIFDIYHKNAITQQEFVSATR